MEFISVIFSSFCIFTTDTEDNDMICKFLWISSTLDCETNKHSLHNENARNKRFKIGTKYCNSITGDCHTKSCITYIAHVKHY